MIALEDKMNGRKLPEKSGKYKIIYLEVTGKHHLIIDSVSYDLMLKKFFKNSGIDYQTELKTFPSGYCAKLPKFINAHYCIKGIGSADVDVKKRTASVYLKSESEESLESLKSLMIGWKITKKESLG